MLAYWCSTSVSALLAKVTGLLTWSKAAPSPTCKASTWTVIWQEVSKYQRVMLLTASLTHGKAVWWEASQLNSASFLSSSCREQSGWKDQNEGVEVCYHVKELLKLCDVSWCGQGMYSINILWILVHSRPIIEASKEFHHWGLDLCFLGVEH